ncbi:MAG: DNA repair protein RecO [Candidatus Pacebacteria bacterium]|nr:DNA repair protein RecO [Candidatus Paceibacterota bacterium]
MHQRYRTKGIFLKKRNQGEADRIFTVFTEQFGKIEVAGRAIRKITSKLRSGADVFYLSELEFIQGKHYKTLTDAVVIDRFRDIRENHQKTEAARKITGILDSLITKEEKDDKVWQLLLESFGFIENSESEKILPDFGGITAGKESCSWQTGNCKSKIVYYFLWNLLSVSGYSPELYKCSVCASKLLPETFFFVPQEGGVVCWQCFSNNDLKSGLWFNIHTDTVKILRVYLKEGWDIAGKLRIATDIRQNLSEISDNYCDFLRESAP